MRKHIAMLSPLILLLFVSQCYALNVNDERISTEWVSSLFPKINNCTPKDWYSSKNITANLLEKRGYKAYEIGEFSAKYQIKERFFGFDAIEISIPSGEDSIYTVTVQVSAERLASQIKRVTGNKIFILRNDERLAKSGSAYIVPLDKSQSMFVCFTYGEGF
ncbi:MAG: hypothetical protein A2Z95_03710 [Gallionellales bacterium GWA2_60_18]|nr:MAG: hypothetical protein A2Z95_03710 [Gallionellales bacterium GWA2_60_18]